MAAGDTGVRTLARRWATTRDPELGASYLRALLRAQGDPLEIVRVRRALGQLDGGQLEVAAELRHPVALALLEREAGPRWGLSDWILHAPEWGALGRRVSIRLACGAARALVPAWRRLRPWDRRPEGVLDALEAWLDAPSEEALERVRETNARLIALMATRAGGYAERAVQVLPWAVFTCGGAALAARADDDAEALERCATRLAGEELWELPEVEAEAEALERDVGDWVLGLG